MGIVSRVTKAASKAVKQVKEDDQRAYKQDQRRDEAKKRLANTKKKP